MIMSQNTTRTFVILSISFSQKIIIPMDQTQNDHLKAYGIVYSILEKKINIEWLLNYRGGSFLVDLFLVKPTRKL